MITRFFNLRNGGIGRFSVEMLEGLKKSDFDTVGVSTGRLSSTGHVVYSVIDLAFRMPRDCDVYHCLTPAQALYAPKQLSVVTFHDLIPWLHLDKTRTHYAQGTMKVAKRWLSHYYFNVASKIAARSWLVACNSEFTRKELLEHVDVDESKVSVVRLGISRQLEPRPKTDRIFRVGTLSNLDPRKRIDLLIRAFLSADVDGELVIAGAGSEYLRLKDCAQGDRRIKFLGFVPDERLPDFYNSLDVFVFPSKIEGYGLPIVEAFACKKDVVVLSDAVMDNEIKARCTVVEDLTAFLKDPKVVCDIDGNYSFAIMHDWDKCVQDYIGLYRRILEQRG